MKKGGHPEVVIPGDLHGDWESPSWCADGRHVVCSRDLGGRKTLYLVDTWYGKVQKLHAGDNASLPDCSSK